MAQSERRLTAPALPPVHIVTVLWGADYATHYAQICIASLLAPGNLPALAARRDCRYLLLVDEAARDVLGNHPAFHALDAVCPIEMRLDSGRRAGERYADANALHARAIAEAQAERAALMFVPPDTLYSDGTFAAVADLAASGARVVYICPPRVARSAFAERLAFVVPGKPLAVGADWLLDVALDCLHPMTKLCFWDAPKFSAWPHHVFFRAGNDLLVRGLHLHPLYVAPAGSYDLAGTTYDIAFPTLACPDYAGVRVIDDSRTALMIEFTREGRADFAEVEPEMRDRALAHFAEVAALRHHLLNGATAIRFRHGAEDAAAWGRAVSESEAVMRRLWNRAARDSRRLVFDDPMAVFARGRRLATGPLYDLRPLSRLERRFLDAVYRLLEPTVKSYREDLPRGRGRARRNAVRRLALDPRAWARGIWAAGLLLAGLLEVAAKRGSTLSWPAPGHGATRGGGGR